MDLVTGEAVIVNGGKHVTYEPEARRAGSACG
jgi:hypothetical protein